MSEAIFKVGFEKLSAKPFTSAGMIKLLPQLIRLKSYQTVYRFVVSYIKNPYLQKVFSIHPLLVGGNPIQRHPSTPSYTTLSASGAFILLWVARESWSKV